MLFWYIFVKESDLHRNIGDSFIASEYCFNKLIKSINYLKDMVCFERIFYTVKTIVEKSILKIYDKWICFTLSEINESPLIMLLMLSKAGQ